jgi:transcriptional regulator with XRE-family HTH domain
VLVWVFTSQNVAELPNLCQSIPILPVLGGYGAVVEDLQRRLRAARGHGGLSQEQLADRLELSDKTYKLTELGQRVPKRSELLAIAEACKVPMWFLEHGWKGWMKGISPEELRQIADELPPPPGE